VRIQELRWGDLAEFNERVLTLSAKALAAEIASKSVTSMDVINAHIGQIERVNGDINAVVVDRFALARDEARAADAVVADVPVEELSPFHGVPCTVKECFALSGMPNTSGLAARVGCLAEKDATVVARIRAAGAIPLGVTNVSELCMWMESNNRVYGRTNNPYDSSRMVGGSSGGEGAIIGAGASPFGVGSDIGGSIRLPAFFNGIFGHKPSGDLVPGSGQYPIAENEALSYLATGPLCRKAEDLWPLLNIMRGPDGIDARTRDFELGNPDEVSMEGLRVLYVPGNGVHRVSKELRSAQRAAARALQDRGAIVVEKDIPALKYSFEIWSQMLSAAGGHSFRELLANHGELHLGKELFRWITGKGAHTIPALALAWGESLSFIVPDNKDEMITLGAELRAELTREIGPQGIMLFPPFTKTAPRHYLQLLQPLHAAYTAIFNVMELPVTQVPLGLDSGGLPLGVQVVSTSGQDHLCVATALELERALGGWVPPWTC